MMIDHNLFLTGLEHTVNLLTAYPMFLTIIIGSQVAMALFFMVRGIGVGFFGWTLTYPSGHGLSSASSLMARIFYWRERLEKSILHKFIAIGLLYACAVEMALFPVS